MFKKVCIIGAGLLGGSLAKRLKAQSPELAVNAWARSERAEKQLRESTVFDRVSRDIGQAVSDADLVVLCSPVDTFGDVLKAMLPSLSVGCTVTDVGSTKAMVCRTCETVLAGRAHFVGAHPMAGSEKSGIANAVPDLFDGQVCFITPTAQSDATAVKRVTAFWQSVGLRTFCVDPDEHDRIVAAISHLPHTLAVTLCNVLGGKPEAWLGFAGNGLRDTTRIAAGLPDLWQSILLSNREALLAGIEDFERHLKEIKSALREGDREKVVAYLSRGKSVRDSF